MGMMMKVLCFVLATDALAACFVDQCTCSDIKQLYVNNTCCAEGSANKQLETRPSIFTQSVGGTLYVHDATGTNTTWAHEIDLSKAALQSKHSDCFPAKTPHMVIPQPVAHPAYVAVTYTSDKVVHILDAKTYEIVLCFGVPDVEDARIHDGAWHREGNAWYFVLVDMTGHVHGAQGGGGLHLFRLDLADFRATRLSSWSAPLSLSMHPADTKPIAIGTNPASNTKIFYVTDAFFGGGYFVGIQNDSIQLVHHVSNTTLVNGGCARPGSKLFGLWISAHPTLPDVAIAEYGQQIAGYSCLVILDLAAQTVKQAVPLSPNGIDAHGIDYCRSGEELFIVVSHRVSATMDIIRYSDGAIVEADIDLNALLNGSFAPVSGECESVSPPEAAQRFQPDVFSVLDNKLYFTARGRRPLSAVLYANWLEYAAPGMYVFEFTDDCRGIRSANLSVPVYDDRALTSASDPHGGALVATKYWLIDQSPTGFFAEYAGRRWHLSRSQIEAMRQQGEDFLFVSQDSLPRPLPCLLTPPSSPPAASDAPPRPPAPPPLGAGGMG